MEYIIWAWMTISMSDPTGNGVWVPMENGYKNYQECNQVVHRTGSDIILICFPKGNEPKPLR